MILEPHPNDDVRSSRKAGCFPYGYPGAVCYIEVSGAGGLRQIQGRGEIRDAVVRAERGESRIYAAWPGQYRTDLFFIDDLPALKAAASLKSRVSS